MTNTWPRMSRSASGLAAVLASMTLAISPALAQGFAPLPTPSVSAAPATNATPLPPACDKPAPPRYPRAGQELTLEQLEWTRDQRDRFVSASSSYLTCLDREIETRMRRMMELNTDDPRVNQAGYEHQAGSAAVGEAIKAFALLCYDYEGRTGSAYSAGCVPGASR